MKYLKLAAIVPATMLAAALAGCAGGATEPASNNADQASSSSLAQASASVQTVSEDTASSSAKTATPAADAAGSSSSSAASTATTANTYASTAAMRTDGLLDTSDMFTERDLAQSADLSGATQIQLADGQSTTISDEGVYVVSGSASEASIRVEADETAKVQIVLDGASFANTSIPAIYVVSADKVFVTLEGENAITVSGTFEADGETNVDAAIFSKEDLVLNGTGSLTISSTANGITSKDDLKVTGGTYHIEAAHHALEANDSVRIADGVFTLTAGTDGIHCANDEDDTLGWVYLCGATLDISSGSDGIEGYAAVQIDAGTIRINGAEGIEGTFVQINDGTVDVAATDDGINAPQKSSAYTPTIEINGGSVAVAMAQGDTDALDSNGYLIINGGVVDISAQFAFDFILGSQLNGGEVYVNGEQVTEIAESMMMGGGRGGMGGGMGGTPPMDGGAPPQGW